MAVSDLDIDEAVILQEEGVRVGSSGSADLVLTNKNIIQVNRGFWGGTKGSIKYPLESLKTLNGKANVRVGKDRSGVKQLELYFADCNGSYQFNHMFAENNWMREIIKAHKSRMAAIENEQKAKRDKPSILQSITGTIESAKDGLLAKRSQPQKTCKCPKCGAELTGIKGAEVQCSYCDTIVIIK